MSQRKSAEKHCITVDSNKFPQGHKVEGCVQLRMSGNTQLAFNSVDTWPSKRRGVMIAEFDKKPPASEGTESGNDEEVICTRAYELYVEGGMEDRHDVEDWFRGSPRSRTGRK